MDVEVDVDKIVTHTLNKLVKILVKNNINYPTNAAKLTSTTGTDTCAIKRMCILLDRVKTVPGAHPISVLDWVTWAIGEHDRKRQSR